MRACDLFRPILASGAAPDAASARPWTRLSWSGQGGSVLECETGAIPVRDMDPGHEVIANRLRAYLIDRAGKEDGRPRTLAVRAWLNPDGTVEWVSFDALKGARADADLRTILKRGNVGDAPPPEMLQPLALLAQSKEINPAAGTARRSAKYFTRVDVKDGGISAGCGEGRRIVEEKTKELIAASLSHLDVKSGWKNPIVLRFMPVIPGG
jgi:hypothetical protein